MTLSLPLPQFLRIHCETHLSAWMRDLRRICVRRRKVLVLSGCYGSANVFGLIFEMAELNVLLLCLPGAHRAQHLPRRNTNTHSFCLDWMVDWRLRQPHRTQTLSCCTANTLCGQSFLLLPFTKPFLSHIINGSLEQSACVDVSIKWHSDTDVWCCCTNSFLS